jgi:glutathione S-transferase
MRQRRSTLNSLSGKWANAMMTLYDFLPSGNGYKVRLTLRELGHRFVYCEVDILRGESHRPWFLEKNPAGQIPVLELSDGTCLSESTAIRFYLAGNSPLLPAARLARSRVLAWMCFEQTHVDGVISRALLSTPVPRCRSDAAARVRGLVGRGIRCAARARETARRASVSGRR